MDRSQLPIDENVPGTRSSPPEQLEGEWAHLIVSNEIRRASTGHPPKESRKQADWFITASDGKGRALILNVPAFPVLSEEAAAAAAAATVKKNCPKCGTQALNASLAELGNNTLIPAIVSALKRSPNVKYIISTDGDFIDGLAPAVEAAGLTGVKSGSINSGIVNEQDVISGKESMALPWPGTIEGWNMIDATARLSEGMTVPSGDSNQPIQLVVKSNVGTPSETLDKPANYVQQYEKLWKVSS